MLLSWIYKREANMKSANMEALALKSGLEKMEEQGLKVLEVVTDAYTSIAKHMSMFCRNIVFASLISKPYQSQGH